MKSGVQCRIHEAAMRLFARVGAGRVNVSDLAAEAGVARGTIYNAVPNPDSLFEDVAGDLAAEMQERVRVSIAALDEPAYRIACGIRLFIRRAHEEPEWGRFIVHFGFSNKTLRGLLTASVADEMAQAIESGRYAIGADQVTAMVAVIGGATLSGMMLVQEGYKSWRDAGSEVAQFILVALGVERTEAAEIARRELPQLIQP
ncbi:MULTISPECIES: TetR/AcrR family transcriptional regulator [Alphaproteobacteria]|nr:MULTISPECIES: TetR/AcrR family transcriptional regulator [Alphaproteobacteria]